jgi:hypothetical protein
MKRCRPHGIELEFMGLDTVHGGGTPTAQAAQQNVGEAKAVFSSGIYSFESRLSERNDATYLLRWPPCR